MNSRTRLTSVATAALTVLATAAAAGPPAAVTVDGQQLSARVREAAPREVLAALARGAGVRIVVRGEVPDAPISVTIDAIEVTRGVARLLAGASYLLVYEEATLTPERGVARLSEIHVIAWPGRPTSATPAPAQPVEQTAPGSELAVAPGVLQHEALGAPEPEQRADALHILAYLGKPEVGMPTLEHALADPHESVRARALELIKDTGDGAPFDALAHMARGDRSPRLRAAALALLAEREDVRAVGVLRLGLNDPARVVRERAQALLDDLHADVLAPPAARRR